MQKPQPMAQPTWVERQSVLRTRVCGSSSSDSGSKLCGPASSGMYTLSMNFPSGVRNRYLRVPSADCCTASIARVSSRVSLPSLSRKARGRSVISSSDAAPLPWSQA